MSAPKLESGLEPMAIVGMGCRWAGGVRDVRGLWEFLISKRNAYQDWAAPRFSAAGFYHPNPARPGTSSAKGGYVITEDPQLFDPSFFGISGLEAETLDASQRKLLEVVYEAFESAGDSWESIDGSRTGVYVADISYDYAYAQTRDWEYARPHATTGACHNMVSNRINYVFNLRGPSITLDSACTSAMYALHMAIQAIRNGDCDSAIVASSNWIMDPNMQFGMDRLGALSSTSTSRAFDASANGYARGEGFAAIYLKKPMKAMQDRSPIRALVRGSAVGSNGRSSGITHPSGAAQVEIIRKAYENAGLSPSDTIQLECHGTGTRVGDPIEVEAAGEVFGPGRSPDSPLLIGSVKTNLGHTEGAAALAGIFKAIVSIEAGAIPPSLLLETPNPKIDFSKAKAEVVTEVTAWPAGKVRRVSVTSAGFGGSIGHCILDHVNEVYPGYVKPGIMAKHISKGSLNNGSEYVEDRNISTNITKANPDSENRKFVKAPAVGLFHDHQDSLLVTGYHQNVQTLEKVATADADTREFVLLPFSAHSKTSLHRNISALSDVIDQHSLADIAYTLAERRTRFSQRTYRVASKENVTRSLLADAQNVVSSSSEVQHPGFVFTGQGAQWYAMGARLFEYRVFRSAIEQLDCVLKELAIPPTWTIADVLSGNCKADRIEAPEVAQTVCTALQIGLVNLLASWSIFPVGVIGHSSGEIAAAYAAGRITAAESIIIAYLRGRTVSRNKQQGAMLAVGLGLHQVEDFLAGMEHVVKIAAINSPGSVTLSGEKWAVEEISREMGLQGVFNRLLKTGGNAYHSHHMLILGQEYDKLLSDGLVHLDKLGLRNKNDRRPRIPWVSTVTPDTEMLSEDVPTSYWRANLESPVRFSNAAIHLVRSEAPKIGVLVEIGPHFALKGPLEQTIKSIGVSIPYAGSLKRGEDGRTSILQLAGTLFSLNATVDLAAVNAMDGYAKSKRVLIHGVTCIDLPIYQHTYGPVASHESRISKEFRLRRVPRHDLVGSKIAGNAKLRPQFRNILRLNDLPWLAHHRLLPDVVFPAAGYIAMAMVAASQVYEEFEDALAIQGYSLRNVEIKTAMKIPEDQEGIETILSLELTDNATARNPAWNNFCISSVTHDSGKWTEHCTGSIKLDVARHAVTTQKLNAAAEYRIVQTNHWYKKFAAVGLGYGPTFQALSEVRADRARNMASAKLGLKTTSGIIEGGESAYPIHPASLDAMIQLGLIASHGGQVDRVTTASVPIHLSHLRFQAGIDIDQDWAIASAHGDCRGLRSSYLQLQMESHNGNVILDIKDLRCVSYSLDDRPSRSSLDQYFASPVTRLVCKPDFRTLSNQQANVLFPPPEANIARVPDLVALETMASLFAVDIYYSLGSRDISNSTIPTATSHYLSWIGRLVASQSESIVEASQLSASSRQEKLEALFSEFGDLVETQALRRLYENMGDIGRNRTTGDEVLAGGGLLADLYTDSLFLTGAIPQLTSIIDSISHANPSLRILELRAGQGHTARLVLQNLTDGNKIKRYTEYTVTDLTEAALTPAHDQLAGYSDVSFSVLDLEHDPLRQGYQPTYDIVLASQAMHTMPSISKALTNARKLLKPGAKIVLVEATGTSAWLGLVGGAQKGYWHGVPDGRTDGPFLDTAAWDRALVSAGFSGAELTLDDYPPPHSLSTVIVSSVLNEDQNISRASDPTVWLLHGENGAPLLCNQLANSLEGHGVLVKMTTLHESVKEVGSNERVIAFLDGGDLLLDIDQHRLEVFQYLAHSSSSMLWLTSTGMSQGRNPDGAVVCGLIRTISTEFPTGRFAFIDIDAENFNILGQNEQNELIRAIIEQELALQRPESGGSSDDREFAWQHGSLWVRRLVPEPTLSMYADPEQLVSPTSYGTKSVTLDTQGPVRAAFETPGILSSLYFRPYPELLHQPLLPNWIEVKVAAVGLNWKDVALCTGRFDANNLSTEYAGFVTRVGTEAASLFQVGDRVYGLGKGYFGNYARVPAALAQKADPGDDIVDVATLPVVMMTAVYAFEHLTHLRQGQKVLIQSASGGLGLAAIQLAQAKGAEVYAMVGSQDKMQFLVESFGLAATHVFMAREPETLADAVAEIFNRDNSTRDDDRHLNAVFDVVLSTSQGEMLHETAKALAPLGHLVDVGRLDVMDARGIGLELFQKGASFSSFDMVSVADRNPCLGAQVMQAVGEHYRAGRISPVRPLNVSDISHLDQTLLRFSRGTHFGKLVVKFNADSQVKMVNAPPATSFDPEACYIITGGLSGLGRSIIQWMSKRGVRHIFVLSRRGPEPPEAEDLVQAMARRGVCVEPIACNLESRSQVLEAVTKATKSRKVRGVVHCAVLYQDISFSKIFPESWRDGIAAKVHGTRNLHEATKDLPLDFFVMTTSVNAGLAFATQAAYNAANNFQDSFARYRHRLGLPATAVQFGLINDTGHLSSNQIASNLMERNRVPTLSEDQFLRLLEPAFQSPRESHSSAPDPLSRATYVTCMDPAQMAMNEREDAEAGAHRSATPRWHSDPQYSHVIQAFRDALRHAESEDKASTTPAGDARSAVVRLRLEFDTAVQLIQTAPAGDEQMLQRARAVEIVRLALRNMVAEMLLVDQSVVDPSRSVVSHGVDSLIATEFRNWLHMAFGSKISMVDLLDSRVSIGALASKIVDSRVKEQS